VSSFASTIEARMQIAGSSIFQEQLPKGLAFWILERLTSVLKSLTEPAVLYESRVGREPAIVGDRAHCRIMAGF
jgi:hypothetical protein